MNTLEFIDKARRKTPYTEKEINDFITGVVRDEIPDYQTAAWLMAVTINGLNELNRTQLTLAMRDSGDCLNLKSIAKPKIDKHSTGGVGDKASFICMAIASAAGVCVPSFAGRSLGFTGGTIDKLESIPGLNTSIEDRIFKNQLEGIGWVISAQTDKICPADKRLYALRDVTNTVDSMDLITASILSKKFTEDLDGLVMDVKYGSGALMSTLSEARSLGRSIMQVAGVAGLKCSVLYTSMDQPLGRWCGNLCEVIESIEILNHDIKPFYEETLELSIKLASQMILLSGVVATGEEADKKAKELYENKRALDQFVSLVEWQGGMLDQISFADAQKIDVVAPRSGFVTSFETKVYGQLLIDLGAGRSKKSDKIEPLSSLEFHKKIGDEVTKGEPIFSAYHRDAKKLKAVIDGFLPERSVSIGDSPAPRINLVEGMELLA